MCISINYFLFVLLLSLSSLLSCVLLLVLLLSSLEVAATQLLVITLRAGEPCLPLEGTAKAYRKNIYIYIHICGRVHFKGGS